jgi:hypothetical protein
MIEQIIGFNRMQQSQSPQGMMQGGAAIQSIYTMISKLDSPMKLIYGFIVILIIVYSSEIPADYRTFTDSFLGKIFGVGIVYGVIETMGWVYGLLTAMAFLLILNGAPRKLTSSLEGFDGGGSVTEKKAVGKRWFVEKVLGERTTAIATDRVTTNAITD